MAAQRSAASGVSSIAFDEMHATLYAGKRMQLEQLRTEQLLRDDADDAAPPRSEVDLYRPTAFIWPTRP